MKRTIFMLMALALPTLSVLVMFPATTPQTAARSRGALREFHDVKPQRYAVFGSGSDPLYSFFLPITALIWKRNQKFEPLIILVNDVQAANNSHGRWDTGHAAVVTKYLQKWGFSGNVVELEYNATASQKNNVLLSQLVRIYAAGMCGLSGPLSSINHPDTWVVSTDVDIFPIASGSYYLPDSDWLGKITNAFCCTAGYQVLNLTVGREYPMTTIAFQVKTWQDLMNYTCLCNGQSDCRTEVTGRMNQEMQRVFDLGNPQVAVGAQWGYDQRYFSYRIHYRSEIHNRTQLVGRSVGADRIDRAWWKNQEWSEALLKPYVDSHVLRPGYTASNWAALRMLIKSLLLINASNPEDALLWQQMDHYQTEFSAFLRL